MEPLPINGFGIGYFRSFSGPEQLVGPLKKINVFIGENNSGKSNIIRFIRKVYHPLTVGSDAATKAEVDLPKGQHTTLRHMHVMLPIDEASLEQELKLTRRLAEQAKRVFNSASHTEAPPGFGWVPLSRSQVRAPVTASLNSDQVSPNSAYAVWNALTGSSGGELAVHWLPGIYRRAVDALLPKPKLVFIPTLRRIPSRLKEFEDEYGYSDSASIIDELAAYASPEHTKAQDRRKFDLIERFLQKVLKRKTLKLSIPHNKNTIIVEDHGRYLPIETLGTGIHQLVILAAQAVMAEGSVVCIEEPELHFHPELQLLFMHFIWENTSNKYFITTHSAQIMDAVDCAVFRVTMEEGASKIAAPLSRVDRHRICHDLGYKPSSLLQANSLIWVEGPSDRLYVLNWLKAIDATLEEGWHFSIMFYGGRLLSHLSGEDRLLEDFISLLPINRFPAMLIDSDRKCEGSRINTTKARLREELTNVNGSIWITEGREIENYISRSVRESVVQALYGQDCKLIDADDTFGDPLSFSQGGTRYTKPVDKLAIARDVCRSPVDLTVLDLEKDLRRLARFIRAANRMPD